MAQASTVTARPARVVDPERPNDQEPEDVSAGVPAPPNGSAVAIRDEDVDFGEDAGKGIEGIRMEEQVTPFLGILQGLSPQLNRTKPEYVKGAQLGMLHNTATGAVYDGDEGVLIIPVWRDYQYTEWVPRQPEGGGGGGGTGGFRGVHSPDERAVKEAIAAAIAERGQSARFRPIPFRNAETEEDTVLTEQYNLGVLYGHPDLEPGRVRRAMIAFTSTKIGVYRKWITSAIDIRYPNPRQPGTFITPPLWAHRWRLTTVPQSNKKGDFFNYSLRLAEPGEPVRSLVRMSDPLYAIAKEFYAQWEAGQVKVDYSQGAGGEDEDREDASEKMPF